MIAIIDYGMGNLKSVKNALDKLEIENVITNDCDEIRKAKGIILPGVGAFSDAMKNLKECNLIELIKEEAESGKLILGICLGMQVLFEKSYEGEETLGFGFLKGEVVKMEGNKIRIPHIGWNLLKGKDNELISLNKKSYVYFVHSYYGSEMNENELLNYVEYGEYKIPALVNRKNIYGAQFHPEKSGEVGLEILKNFGEMIK